MKTSYIYKTFFSIFFSVFVFFTFFSQTYTSHSIANSLGKGINANQWLSANKNAFDPNRYSEADFIQMHQLGFSHVRIPVGFHKWADIHTGIISDTLFQYLDNALYWGIKNHLKVIIDFHPQREDDPILLNQNNLDFVESKNRIANFWKTVAIRYNHISSDSLLYDIYNEPDFVDKSEYTEFANQVIDSIRNVDKYKTIIIDITLSKLSQIHDPNIIGTFHFYSPGLFTHQGQQWTETPNHTIGVPFPYQASMMPPLNINDTSNINLVNQYSNYPVIGTVENIKQKIKTLYHQLQSSYNIPLYCGEFGVSNIAPIDDKLIWLKTVRESLDSLSIPWSLWSWKGANTPASMQLFNCYFCIDKDSIIKNNTRYNQLCALGFENECFITSTNPFETNNSIAFRVFPNPGNEYLTIENSSLQKITYQLFNSQGKLLFSHTSKTLRNTINTEQISTGVYFISLLHESEEVFYSKWIKQ